MQVILQPTSTEHRPSAPLAKAGFDTHLIHTHTHTDRWALTQTQEGKWARTHMRLVFTFIHLRTFVGFGLHMGENKETVNQVKQTYCKAPIYRTTNYLYIS